MATTRAERRQRSRDLRRVAPAPIDIVKGDDGILRRVALGCASAAYLASDLHKRLRSDLGGPTATPRGPTACCVDFRAEAARK